MQKIQKEEQEKQEKEEEEQALQMVLCECIKIIINLLKRVRD